MSATLQNTPFPWVMSAIADPAGMHKSRIREKMGPLLFMQTEKIKSLIAIPRGDFRLPAFLFSLSSGIKFFSKSLQA
jgi:hypothetical protein